MPGMVLGSGAKRALKKMFSALRELRFQGQTKNKQVISQDIEWQ